MLSSNSDERIFRLLQEFTDEEDEESDGEIKNNLQDKVCSDTGNEEISPPHVHSS